MSPIEINRNILTMGKLPPLSDEDGDDGYDGDGYNGDDNNDKERK